MFKTFKTVLLLVSLATLLSCSGKLFTVHKIDVQQGNALDPEKIEQLRVGMTKDQVRFLMGSPLVTDVFHPDRWDYVYHLIPDFGDTERYHMVVHFEGNTVSNIEKHDIPEPPAPESDENTEAEKSQEEKDN